MRPIVDVWLEIVKGQLAAGDSAVTACLKANTVANAYRERFCKPPDPPMTPEAARVWFEKLRSEGKENETLPIPTSGYVAGDPNARES